MMDLATLIDYLQEIQNDCPGQTVSVVRTADDFEEEEGLFIALDQIPLED
jgi:hypothetical protein